MGSKGRGSLVTMMSKTTANKVIEVIRMLIQQKFAAEVRKAGMISIQMDTTQDLTSKDQCAVVLQYVTDAVHERLIVVIDCESSTGRYFVDLVKRTLEKMDIDLKQRVDTGCLWLRWYSGRPVIGRLWFDAWPLQSTYRSVLEQDTVVASESLFSRLNDIAVFIRDSYKRMKLWEETMRTGDTEGLV